MEYMDFRRRRSSIFPQYLRRKSQRKDSTFASESTNNLYPLVIDEKRPGLNDYQTKDAGSAALKFGWINGVFIRTVMNIFGVMLFLRMGWMTGLMGIVVSLVIVLVSTLLTLCTTLSMSAICTNGEIGTGGIYYMISRSLGAEAGSMIGIVFSFANAVLVSLNLVGAAETVVEIFQLFEIKLVDSTNDIRIYATILLIIVAIIPLIGMEWEAKAMFAFLIILLVSIINYIVGTFLHPSEEKIAKGFVGWQYKVMKNNLWPQAAGNLAEVFSVFFPSVIGIFAGASMSGDLRDPNAAIPKGTFLAILFTSSIYMILVVFLGFTVFPYASGNYTEMSTLEDVSNLSCFKLNKCTYGLVKHFQTMALSSAFEPLIYAGIFAACVSSALGSYVCAPRIFQALCEDKLFPYIHYFAKGYGKINDPRRGYILTFLISLVFIMIGDVNAIAPIISNFFMASFFLVNITCFHASFVGSPSFRPTFKYYNKWISFVTGIICVAIMFYLEPISAAITLAIMFLIFLYIYKLGPDVNWGTSTRGHIFNNALFSALRLNQTQDHVKDFRPSILLLTGNPSARIPLVEFANTITANRSLLMIGHVVNYDIPCGSRKKVIDAQYEWMSKRKIKAFYILLESNSLTSGTKTMLQICGLGRKLSPNIVMMGYKSSWRDCITEDLIDYYNVILTAYEMYIGVIILRVQEGLDYADFFGPFRNSITEEYHTPDINGNNKLGNIPETDIATNNGGDSNDDDNDNDNQKEKPTTVHFEDLVNFKTERLSIPSTRSILSKNKQNLENIKTLIPMDAIEAINQFSGKQKNGFIDIYWLAEDGGLIILIPYLLSITYNWSSCHIRVFCLSKTEENVDTIRNNMILTLKRLRIPYKSLLVISESELQPSEQSKDKFKSNIEKFMVKNESSIRNQVKLTKSDLSRFEEKTNKYLKIRDLLLRHSKTSTLVVMTLPLPNREILPSLYMSWLETITEDMPPFLFVRGHSNVLST